MIDVFSKEGQEQQLIRMKQHWDKLVSKVYGEGSKEHQIAENLEASRIAIYRSNCKHTPTYYEICEFLGYDPYLDTEKRVSIGEPDISKHFDRMANRANDEGDFVND